MYSNAHYCYDGVENHQLHLRGYGGVGYVNQ
jgi:hypothetical protein